VTPRHVEIRNIDSNDVVFSWDVSMSNDMWSVVRLRDSVWVEPDGTISIQNTT
jgi:hypothetical protein